MIALIIPEPGQRVLGVSANGYGKLSSAYEYRRTGRGGQGIQKFFAARRRIEKLGGDHILLNLAAQLVEDAAGCARDFIEDFEALPVRKPGLGLAGGGGGGSGLYHGQTRSCPGGDCHRPTPSLQPCIQACNWP